MKDLLLRRDRETDRQALQELLANYQMASNIDPAEFWVAEVNKTLIGAVMLEWENRTAYLQPIAVISAYLLHACQRAGMADR